VSLFLFSTLTLFIWAVFVVRVADEGISNNRRYRSVSLGQVGEHAIGSHYLRVLSRQAREGWDCTHVPCFLGQPAGISGGCDRANPTGDCASTVRAKDAVGLDNPHFQKMFLNYTDFRDYAVLTNTLILTTKGYQQKRYYKCESP
jgi:hypothetical protein